MLLDIQLQYLLFLQGLRTATGNIFDTFFLTVTKFGEWSVVFFVVAFVYWCVCEKQGGYLLLLIALSTIVNQFAKMTACIYRPWILDSAIQPVPAAISGAGGYSFPSGHTATAVSSIGGTAYIFRKNKFILTICLIIVALVIFSRNYLGVHTPQDVIVSATFGVILIFAVKKLLDWMDGGAGRDRAVLAIVLGTSALLLLYLQIRSYPMDYVDGKLLVDPARMLHNAYGNISSAVSIALGWFACRRLLNFKAAEGTWGIKAARYIIGATGLWLIFAYLPAMTKELFGNTAGNIVFYACLGLYVTFLYPAACVFFKKIITTRR